MDVVVFDYRQARKTRSNPIRTVELGPWLEDEKNKKRIYNMRLLYVLKPVGDDTIKFGVAGLTGEASTYGRLHQYINEYGYRSDLNQCAGIDMLYLGGTAYKSNVKTVDSKVWMKEAACKAYFRSDAIKGRGFERILQERLDELFTIIDDKSNKSFEDIETIRRQSERLQQAEIKETDKIVKVISHHTKGGTSKAMTKYTVKWNRPYVLTQKKKVNGKIVTTETTVDTTEEYYKNIIVFPGGDRAMNNYKIMNPDAKFRD